MARKFLNKKKILCKKIELDNQHWDAKKAYLKKKIF